MRQNGTFHEYNMPLKRGRSKHTLHKSCRVSTQIVHPLKQAQCSGNDQVGCFARIIVAGGYIICVGAYSGSTANCGGWSSSWVITIRYAAPIANTVPKFIFIAAVSAENGSTAVRSASSASRSATAARIPWLPIILIFNVRIRLCAVKTCAEADSYVVCNITRCMKNT